MDRRSFLTYFGGLAALVPGVSWARGRAEGQSYRFDPQGEVYSPADLSTDFLELPPAVPIFEWWDDAAVPTRYESIGPGKSQGWSIGVRRLHIWTRVPEQVSVSFEVPFPGHPRMDTRRFQVPLLDFPEGREALIERVWDVWKQGRANPVVDERGYHLGDIVWVTVGNRERLRHGIAWVPFADEVFEAGIASKMHLSLPVALMECGVKVVGDQLTQEEKSALTGQGVVGDLHLDQLDAITGLTWSDSGNSYYEGTGRGLRAYLEQDSFDGSWGLTVWDGENNLAVPYKRFRCPYTLCRELLPVGRV